MTLDSFDPLMSVNIVKGTITPPTYTVYYTQTYFLFCSVTTPDIRFLQGKIGYSLFHTNHIFVFFLANSRFSRYLAIVFFLNPLNT